MLSDREILELAERAKAGEKEALGRLAGDLRRLVCRWALVMTPDPDDAEDVAQSVVMRMLTYICCARGARCAKRCCPKATGTETRGNDGSSQ